MFPGTKYFSSIPCPFFESGLCERPHCHYRHIRSRKSPSVSPPPLPTTSKVPLKTLVEDAVKRVLDRSGTSEPTKISEALSGLTYDEKGHRLYLPPKDCPTYKPTPIEQLKKNSYIPQGVLASSSLTYRPSPLIRRKNSAVPCKEILGDIDDLSESNDDDDDNPNVVGSILLQGVKTGVLESGSVNEFDQEVIKNRYKKKKKKEDPVPKKEEEEKEDEVVTSCDKVTSSSKEIIVISEDDDDEEGKETEKERKLRLEREEAKRKLEEKEMELKKLEEKRKVLEDYYKNKQLIISSSTAEELTKKKEDIDGSTSSSSSSDDYDDEHRRKKRRKHRHHHKRNKSRKKSKKKYRSHSSSSKKKKRQRHSSSSSSSSYSSSSSISSSSEEEDRHHSKKKKKSKKSKCKPEEFNVKQELLEKNNREELTKEPVSASKIKPDLPETDNSKINEEVAADEELEIPPEEELPETVRSFLEVMSELDKKNNIKIEKEDKSESSISAPSIKNQRPSSSHHHHHKSGSSSSKHISSSKHKSSHHKSSSSGSTGHHKSSNTTSTSHHKSSSTDKHSSGHHHKSSDSHRKSSDSHHKPSSGSSHHKSSSDKGSSVSHHKSSSSKPKPSSSGSHHQKTSVNTNEKPKKDPEIDKLKEGLEVKEETDSPLPDLTEELDMLPDELNDDGSQLFDDEEFENDDDELRRIFDEYEDPKEPDVKKSQEEPTVPAESTTVSSKSSKKRVAHKQEDLGTTTFKRRCVSSAATQMLNRFKKIQSMRQNAEIENELAALEDEQPKKKKGLMSDVEAKLKARREATEADPSKRTVAHTIKGLNRIAHTPTVEVSKPIIAPDSTSKIPSSIRQKYLNSIVEECLKIYKDDKTKAYSRALKEEQTCSDRSKSRNIYINVVVNCIKKLRNEISKPSAVISSANMGTHMQILAGKRGTVGTWSFERPKHVDLNNITNEMYYNVMLRYKLTEKELEDNGFPLADPEIKGKAIIKDGPYQDQKLPQPTDPGKRRCDRCETIYRVDRFGRQIDKEECLYHWGRLYRQKGNRVMGSYNGYSCCKGESKSDGCQLGSCHVTDVMDYNNLRGFVTTLEPARSSNDYGIFALDCEMCNTTLGNELTRITVIDITGKTVYETLVKPENEITDYNTRFSGIKKEDLEGVTTTIRDVQAVLLSMFSSKTILIGHSLESDLKALRVIHRTVVDTSIAFPHKMGPPYKKGLRNLAAEYLKRIIQNEVGGHDSAEDALACLDLMKMKAKEDIKKMHQLAKKSL